MKTKIGLLFACGIAVAAPAVYSAEAEIKTFPAAEVNSIEIKTGAGDIAASGSIGDIKVVITDNEPGKCIITIKTEGKTLVLRADDSGYRKWFKVGNDGCHAGFKISMPTKTAISAKSGSGSIMLAVVDAKAEARTGSGDISVARITGDFAASTGSGNISGSVCSKNLEAHTGSGDITLAGLCGSAEAKTGSGNLTMVWDKAPQTGMAGAKTGSGDVSMTFPASTGINADLKKGSGNITNEFEGGKGSFNVVARTGSGDISLLKAEKTR